MFTFFIPNTLSFTLANTAQVNLMILFWCSWWILINPTHDLNQWKHLPSSLKSCPPCNLFTFLLPGKDPVSLSASHWLPELYQIFFFRSSCLFSKLLMVWHHPTNQTSSAPPHPTTFLQHWSLLPSHNPPLLFLNAHTINKLTWLMWIFFTTNLAHFCHFEGNVLNRTLLTPLVVTPECNVIRRIFADLLFLWLCKIADRLLLIDFIDCFFASERAVSHCCRFELPACDRSVTVGVPPPTCHSYVNVTDRWPRH